MKISLHNEKEASEIDPQGVKWPADTIVAYAWNGESKPIGRLAIFTMPHMEAVWVDERHRGSTVMASLSKELEALLKSTGKTHAFAFASLSQPEVIDYLIRLGYRTHDFIVLSKEL